MKNTSMEANRQIEVILPTRDIALDFSEYDDLFYFYYNGVKGILHTSVILSRAWEDKESDVTQKVIDEVMQYFTLSSEASMCYITGNYILNYYLESMVKHMSISINEMMKIMFMHDTYYIEKNKFKWIDNDLMVTAVITDHKHIAR